MAGPVQDYFIMVPLLGKIRKINGTGWDYSLPLGRVSNFDYPTLHSVKGGVYILRALLTLKSTKQIFHDVSKMRRYSGNILQWRRIETKSMNSTHWRLLI